MLKSKFVVGLAVIAGLGLAQPLAAQSLTAQDYAEITQLYHTYVHAIDSGDAETWADTFTADGVFGNATGRDALVAFAEGFHAQQQGYARHWNGGIKITPTAEGADGRCYLILYNVGSRPPTVTVTGVYIDTLVRTSDGWRFQTRRVEADRPAPSEQ